MRITLNNRPEEFDSGEITVDELLKLKNMTFRMRIVKINGRLIDRDLYLDTTITDGDDVQVIYLMSGG
ncbi:MAG: sulfur carrier protein ThiS [Bacteroidales bacterium]|jgi:thiamine biosynthesis protein ThiS|nr:sulfur carrier protein ThiS [Bacteroidales bacterium]